MSEMNVTPATEAASSDTRDFLSSVGESEKRVRVSGKAVSDEVVLSTKGSSGLRAAVSRPSCVASTS